MKKQKLTRRHKVKIKGETKQENTRIAKHGILLAAAVIILCLVAVAPYFAKETADETQKSNAIIKSFSAATDRRTYHGGENMWINVTVGAEKQSVAGINVHGIKAKGAERLRISTNQTLEKGLNSISVQYILPPCTGCAGISPGNYTVTTEIKAGAETRTQDSTVEILQ